MENPLVFFREIGISIFFTKKSKNNFNKQPLFHHRSSDLINIFLLHFLIIVTLYCVGQVLFNQSLIIHYLELGIVLSYK